LQEGGDFILRDRAAVERYLTQRMDVEYPPDRLAGTGARTGPSG